MSKRSSSHIYDYIIVGAGLSGLSIAAALSQFTDNLLLLEGADQVGGFNRSIRFPTGLINNGIRFYPNTNASQSSIDFLENILGLKLAGNIIESSPVTYENGSIRPFVGFGDNPPDFYEEIQYFTHSEFIQLKVQPYEWPQLLMNQFAGDFHPRSYVTKFIANDEGRVTQVMVNGAKTYNGQNFIFCGPVKSLNVLMPNEAMSTRARQKLAKNTYWTGLCLDLCHNAVVTESNSIHVLNGTTQDEIGPCAGHFLAPQEHDGKMIQNSQWITFFDEDVTEDSETIGHALKKIKRQIKRAYPEALENLVTERIMVAPMIGGNGDLKISADQTVNGLDNLWIGTGTMSGQRNLVGALSQAQIVLASLGFQVEHKLKVETTNQQENSIESSAAVEI